MTDATKQRARSAGAPRMPLLDLMRFVLAAAVVLYHFTATPTVGRYLEVAPTTAFPALNEVTRYGWLGVQAFFVISGLVITRSAVGGSLRRFVTSRAVRLLPAYWACVVLTAGLRFLWDDERRPGVGEVLANLTMVQGQFGVPSLQVVFWTLLVELKFYLLVACLLALGPLTRRRVLLLATVWPVVALVVELGLAQGPGGASATALRWTAELVVPPYAACFGLGMVLHVLREDPRCRAAWWSLALVSGLVVRTTVAEARAATALQEVPVGAGAAVVVLLVAVVLLVVATWVRVPAGVARACTVLGALSYPLYLVHVEFGYLAIDVVGHRGSWLPALVAALVTALVLSVVVQAVEKRTAPRLRRALAPRTPPQETSEDGSRAPTPGAVLRERVTVDR